MQVLGGKTGGVQYQTPWQPLVLKIERDPNDYQHEPGANNQPQRTPWNFGLTYRAARGLDLSIGYFRADHFLAINDKANHVDPVKGLVGGLVVPGKLLGIPFAFGLGLHLPDDRISRVRARNKKRSGASL